MGTHVKLIYIMFGVQREFLCYAALLINFTEIRDRHKIPIEGVNRVRYFWEKCSVI